MMNTDFGSIEKSLNVETSIVPKEEPKKPELPNVVLKKGDVEKDYKYTRGQLYSLIEKGQEAINGIMEVAGESASPRAYEVAGQLIKSVADSTDKLMDLQKKMKDIDEDNSKTQGNITNNSLFPFKARRSASSMIEEIVLLFCSPLIIGMLQKEHPLSHPSAIFM